MGVAGGCLLPPEASRSAGARLCNAGLRFGDNRRRDPDNYSGKMILDGLVKAGIIRDDSFERIDLTLRRVYDGAKRTEVIVEEIIC